MKLASIIPSRDRGRQSQGGRAKLKYARVVELFARLSGMELEDALAFFYDSDTYALMSEGVADMHCRSDEYLADECRFNI